MPSIHVCPLSKLEQTVQDVGARSLVTLIDRDTPVPRPPSIEPSQHLLVAISDIVERLDGRVLAQAAHIGEFLAFVRAWDRRSPMVIHCYAGVSRSTAAALIAACALEPEVPEEIFARAIRLASPTATPNARLVALADVRLQREGRMIAAIRAIGRGQDCFEGTPFALDSETGGAVTRTKHVSAHEAAAPMPVEVGLTAAIVAISGEERPEPMILVVRAPSDQAEAALPAGSFDPLTHRTFEMGLRAWVSEQTGVPLGYVEQLYTFGDRGRHARAGDTDPHVVSVGYLALTRGGADSGAQRAGARLRSWYDFFPWEDWRRGRPVLLDDVIGPHLNRWAQAEPAGAPRLGLPRAERIQLLFGPSGGRFDDELVLERFECLYEAGLASEARRDGRSGPKNVAQLGQPMQSDHRRILATAMGRLRAKMKYRPVIFELMPERFTLTALQRTAEAISGRDLHKQNFRRVVEASAVVEPTGETSHATGGRPAALYRFRRDGLEERPAPGLRMGPVR